MARKSRKGNVMKTNIPMSFAVGYIRLSVSNKDESCSVANQQRIIERWATEHEIVLSRFYIDENVSGSTFERPAFKEMLSDIDAGTIDCIIVKDLSRFGRELLTTSYYVEECFPSKKVRFVSVNDQFDTLDGINNLEGHASRIRIPLVIAFNEQTSKDISKKTQAALDMKAERGMFIGPRAPYGYKKSDENRFQLVPDPEAAAVVKCIFELASAGYGIPAIARHLNERAVPTPIQYARLNGLEGNYDDGDGAWNIRSVRYILNNRTYTGMLVQGTEKRVVQGTHESLVSIDSFDTIQNMLQQRSFYLTGDSQGTTENILKGKVICGCCGSKMQRRRGTNHADWYFFTCLTNNRVGADHCTGMYVREEDIFSAIYHQLKQWISNNFMSTQDYETQKLEHEQKMSELRAILVDPSESLRLYYEKYVQNEITASVFKEARDKIYEAKERLDVAVHRYEEYEKRHQHFVKMCKARDKELPLAVIMDNIEEILIAENRRIGIIWGRDTF